MAALPPQLIELRDVVLPLVGLTNLGPIAQRQTAQFLALHGLTSTDDFNLVEPHQAKELVKASNSRHPAQAMGILVQNNLTGLIWYVKDRTRRGLPIDGNNIILDDLRRGHMAYEAYIQNRDKGENIKSLEKWNDKLEFDDWDRKVTETLSLIYGRNYCPIAYVIRPDKPAGWDPVVDAVNDYERLTYQLPLDGIAYDQDNETVFSLIQLAVVHSQAETWIYDHVPGRDGRGAMRALRNHYEGEAELDVQASKAQQVLDTLVYTNEKQMTFEAMITKLNKAYNALKRQGQEFTEKSKVEQLAKRIKNPSRDVQITVAVETMREAHKANYTAATQYITARMAQINSASINAPGSNPRRVSEVSPADLSRNEFNGVDIRDPWRKYTDDEWFNKLGQRGQELVRAKRRPHGGRGHGGRGRRRGRGGRGRGGRGWNNGGGRGGQNQGMNGTNERAVNEASTGDRTNAPAQGNGDNIPPIVNTDSQSQASTGTGTSRGGQNGNRFGTNRP
jgi:hypothetical protein